jgi:recombinational DNA repair ATPase RecF
MDKIKFWVNSFLKFALIALAGFVVYSWNRHASSSIDTEALRKIDSLAVINNSIAVENEKLKLTNENLYERVSESDNQLHAVKPVYQKKINEYTGASKEKKSELVKSEYEKRLREKEGER